MQGRKDLKLDLQLLEKEEDFLKVNSCMVIPSIVLLAALFVLLNLWQTKETVTGAAKIIPAF